MKSFYIVTVLFILMLLASSYNNIYIRNLSDELIQSCENFDQGTSPDLIAERAQKIRDRWKSQRSFVQITVNHTEIELIDNAIDEFCVYAQLGDEADFQRAKQLAVNALEELRQSEVLFPTNIL